MRLLLCGLACCTIVLWGHSVLAKPDYTELSLQAGHGSLKEPQPDYEFTQVTLHFGHDVDEWTRAHWGFNPPGEWDLRISPALAVLDEPKHGVEMSCALGLKVSLQVGGHLRPYAFGGTGPLYTTIDTLEQSTRFNFGSYAGYGLEYRVNDRQGVSFYKLVRHFSNAGIKDPNDGVDTDSWGVSLIMYN
jgi:hypothetical protein